jgi:hypothetical protein
MKPDKLVHVANLREEFEFLLTHDDTAPDWTGHELAMILGRFDRAVQNVCHHRYHRPIVPPEARILERGGNDGAHSGD